MTTRRLVLLRHSKAAQDGPTDAERPLAPRGERDAAAVGRWIREQALVPDRVAVSPALRARQTWHHAAVALGADGPVTAPEPEVARGIYDNTVEALLDVVHETPDDVRTLVLVGHNPSVHGLAVTLDDGEGDERASREVAGSYPTSGVAVFAVDTAWSDLDAGRGTLLAFATPRG